MTNTSSPADLDGYHADANRDVVDLRGEKRASLMLRSAKLICQSGEYPCIVRDVSPGGCKLRLFHEIPRENYLLLELADGETYAMLRVWNREREAGFRFIHPIDVEAFIEESSPWPRRPVRLRMRRPAKVWIDGVAIPVILRDLSTGGAGIESETSLARCRQLRLAVPGLPDLHARVAWRKGPHHGLTLDHSWRMNELADHALRLQPLLPAADVAASQLFDPAEALPRRATA